MIEPSGVRGPLRGRAKAVLAGLTAVVVSTVFISPTTGHAAVPGVNGKIAFVSVRDGNREIYVMNADGSGHTNLTNHPGEDDDPAWSPDGTRIAFASNRSGTLDIFVMNADGTGVTQVTNDAGGNGRPRWSPTGTKIAFTSHRDGHSHIYVMNSDGSAVTRLTSGDASDLNPRWSPDGSRIAFSSDRANSGHGDIYVMDADGGNVTQRTFNSGDNDHPAWSINGATLLFRSGSATAGDVSVMNADGSDVIRLSEDPADDTTPVWSPDGTTVLLSSNRGGQYGICVMNADGSGARCLTNNGDRNPDWAVEKAGSLTGRVTDDATDLPVAGVGVDILDEMGRFISKSWTGADGTYASIGLLPGSYRARTSNTLGYQEQLYDGIACIGSNCDTRTGASIVITGATQTTGIDFALNRGGRIAGVVRDAGSGSPLANVTIQILTAAGSFVAGASTNAAGDFETGTLPAGTYLVRTLNTLGLKDALYSAVDCAPICEMTRATPIVVTVGATSAGVDFGLTAAGGVAGRVITAATGAPLSDVSIHVYESTGRLLTTTATNTSGVYSLSGLSTGTYFARTGNSQGYQDRVYNDLSCPGGECAVLAGNPIGVVEGATRTGVDFVLENRPATALTVSRASAVHGATTNLSATLLAAGSPVVGRTVSFLMNGSPAGTTITDGAGVATISGVSLAAVNARTYSNGVQASFAGDLSHQPISAMADLIVAKRVPVVIWTAPAAIAYGTSLGAAQLNAAADVPGTFVYKPQPGTILPVGAGQALRVTFFPADATNCTTPVATGVVITVDSASAPLQPTYQVLHNFAGADGANPQAGLFQGRDGFLYGSTFDRGANGAGTLYRLDAAGVVTMLHQFATTDGRSPYASPVDDSDGNFYGTTNSGGENGAGTIYRMDTSGALTTLHAFRWSDGARPNAGLIRGTDGVFYGTTSNAGQSGAGTVIRMDASGRVTMLHAFNGMDGSFPSASVIQGSDGYFYGTTLYGGPRGAGTIYRMDSSGAVTMLHALARTEGAYPYAGLIEGSNGYLYGTTISGGPGGGGVVYRVDAEGAVTLLHAFTWSEGINPYAALIQGNDGFFYGTTSNGGPGGAGTVYRMDASGDARILHAFTGAEGASPRAGLVQAADGFFYGTTSRGGAGGVGTVFRVTAAAGSAAAQLVVSAASGIFGGTTNVSATLTSSTATPLSGETVTFAINGRTVATAITNGSGVAAVANVSLTGVHGGTTTVQATFAGDARHAPTDGIADLIVAPVAPHVIWPSPPDIHFGAPLGSLQLNAVADVPGTFTYDPLPGTRLRVGAGQALTAVFTPKAATDYRIVTATTPINVLKALPTIVWSTPADLTFGSALGDVQLNAAADVPGTFEYAPGPGTVLLPGSGHVLTATYTPSDLDAYAPVTATVRITVVRATPLITWAAPPPIVHGTSLGSAQLSAMANVPGTFTYAPGVGAVLPVGRAQALSVTFSPTDELGYSPATRSVAIDVASSTTQPQPTYQVLHSFTRADGARPQAGLVQAQDGDLYGTTSSGGPNDFGTVFRLKPNGPVTVVRALAETDGTSPVAGLLEGNDSTLYGTSVSGGPNGAGTVYRVDAASTVTMVHAFRWSDGARPNAALIQARDGFFYGTTFNGGRAGAGTIVRMGPSGDVTLLYEFTGVAAGTPAANLIQGSDGYFYGTTLYGGPSGVGTVYRMDSSGAVTVLHAFARTDGAYPYAGLLEGSDGHFYGTTISGGPAGLGTVYRVKADGAFTMLHGFTSSGGTKPYAGLIQGSDGFFYGTTVEGGRSALGSVYRMDASGDVTILHAFTGTEGASPRAGLVQAADGFFYGTTSSGGAQGAGTVFRLTPVAGTTAAQMLVAAASGMFGGTTTLSATLTSSDEPLSGETVSFAVNGRSVVTAITDGSGVARVTGVSLAGVRGGTATIQATFAGDALRAVATGTADLTVVPLTPHVLWAAPADIHYGLGLGSLQLRAVADVPGTFVYDPPEGTVLRTGAGQALSAVFTPAAAPDYRVVTATISITVLKASPVIVWKNLNAIASETPLGNAQLNASANVPGTFVYTPSVGSLLPVGSSHTLTAVFTPTDAENYTSQTANASIDVVVPEEIGESEQLAWQQRAAVDDVFGPMRFAVYVDGTRIELTDVSCTALPAETDLLCATSLSFVSLGPHTIELATFRFHKSTVTEGSRSAPLVIRKVAK